MVQRPEKRVEKDHLCLQSGAEGDFLAQCRTHSCQISCAYCQHGGDEQRVDAASGVTVFTVFNMSDTPHTCPAQSGGCDSELCCKQQEGREEETARLKIL